MITEDYVSFEVAKLLKEKGFNRYPLFPCYKEDSGEFIDIPTTLDTINYCFIPAPTHQMALKWLREVHNIYIDILTYTTGKNIQFRCVGYDKGRLFSKEEGKIIYFDTHEQAVESALKYTLENLI